MVGIPLVALVVSSVQPFVEKSSGQTISPEVIGLRLINVPLVLQVADMFVEMLTAAKLKVTVPTLQALRLLLKVKLVVNAFGHKLVILAPGKTVLKLGPIASHPSVKSAGQLTIGIDLSITKTLTMQ